MTTRDEFEKPEATEDDARKWFNAHLARSPKAVIVVFSEEGVGVFDDFDLANEWAQEREGRCTFSALRINDPDFAKMLSESIH